MLYIRYLMWKEVGFGGKVISNEALKNCHKGETVYLTKNGGGVRYAVRCRKICKCYRIRKGCGK